MAPIVNTAKSIGSAFGAGDDPTVTNFRATAATGSFDAQEQASQFKAEQAKYATTDYADAIRRSMAGATTGEGVAGAGAAAGLGDVAARYRALATGAAPSVAEQQLRTGAEREASAAAGAMGSVRGLNPALAARMVLQARTAGQANVANQAATLRAQESQAAMAGEAGALQAQAQAETAGRAQAGNVLQTAGGLETTQAGQAITNLQQAQALQQRTDEANAALNLQAQELDLRQQLANQQAEMEAQRINAGIASGNAQTAAQGEGGLISAAGSAAMMALSDKRFKTDIEREDEEALPGVPKATFKYKGSDQEMEGVIAQDVEKVRPDLVAKDEDGMRYVHPMLAAHPVDEGGGSQEQVLARTILKRFAAGGIAGPLEDTSGAHNYWLNLPPITVAAPTGKKKDEKPKPLGGPEALTGSLGAGAGDLAPVSAPPPPSGIGMPVDDGVAFAARGGAIARVPARPAVPLQPAGGMSRPLATARPTAGSGAPQTMAPVPVASHPLVAGILRRYGGGPIDARSGGKVPGEPRYGHDTEENDTVPAMLTPEERITRLEVVRRPHVGEMLDAVNDDPKVADALAREFVQHIKRRKGRK